MRRRAWFVGVLFLCALPEAQAAFRGFMPLAQSGQLAYNYGYAENGGTQTESTSYLLGWNASGYIWRPWFATTSMALNVGLSNIETSTSSSEGTVGTGNIVVGVFPRSRFPFSMSISRTDSRTEQTYDLAQASGNIGFRVTRLTLRQSYRPRANNQLYNARYSSTKFTGIAFGSDSENYGLDYTLRVPRQTLGISASHSGTRVRGAAGESAADVVSLSHVYTPSAELGVNNLVTYVVVDPGGANAVSTDSQAFSSFFWRPEYRAFSVSGGVRLTENKSEGVSLNTVSRSLSTNLGVGYRLTRSLNMNASASVSTSENGATQSLSTTQVVSVSYTGGQRQWQGYTYIWNWNAGAANATTRVDTGGVSTEKDRQNVNSGIGHNLAKTWSVGRGYSLSGGVSQSASAGKSSGVDLLSKSISHSANLSLSARGGRGSSYISGRLNDSRSFAEKDSAYSSFNMDFVTDMTFNRLSSMSGTVNYQASQNETEGELGGKTTGGTRSMGGSLSYRHVRPFGIYNLKFTANFQGSKLIDAAIPTTLLQARSTFSYNLGLLSTSLGFRVSESAGGALTKSMNFQATRSF